MNNVIATLDPAGLAYQYAVPLPLIGGPRHGQTELFHLVSRPSAGGLTANYKFCTTLPDGRTRWDTYAVQRNEAHEPVAFVHQDTWIYDPSKPA